jgi:hypothetical protein
MGEQEVMAQGDRALTVNVIATTAAGTQGALHGARRLTFAVPARIMVLVPIEPADADDEGPASLSRHPKVAEARQLVAGAGMDATVVTCVCRRPEDLAPYMLTHSSLVIVGGWHNPLWPGREERLALRLMASGYPVLFVGEDRAAAGPRRWLQLGRKRGQSSCV